MSWYDSHTRGEIEQLVPQKDWPDQSLIHIRYDLMICIAEGAGYSIHGLCAQKTRILKKVS